MTSLVEHLHRKRRAAPNVANPRGVGFATLRKPQRVLQKPLARNLDKLGEGYAQYLSDAIAPS
jgi:hypothetical protein